MKIQLLMPLPVNVPEHANRMFVQVNADNGRKGI
jgi:hypothetical protein